MRGRFSVCAVLCTAGELEVGGGRCRQVAAPPLASFEFLISTKTVIPLVILLQCYILIDIHVLIRNRHN